MQKRIEKKPGEWKDKANQAGSTYFVMPELVPGTLREGFERISALPHPLARAAMTMFVVTEVHPFIDGNGRTARLAMNCMLSAANLSRTMIPTVYREDYLLPLKALSHHGVAEPLLAALSRAPNDGPLPSTTLGRGLHYAICSLAAMHFRRTSATTDCCFLEYVSSTGTRISRK